MALEWHLVGLAQEEEAKNRNRHGVSTSYLITLCLTHGDYKFRSQREKPRISNPNYRMLMIIVTIEKFNQTIKLFMSAGSFLNRLCGPRGDRYCTVKVGLLRRIVSRRPRPSKNEA